MNMQSNIEGITGRDDFIQAKALAYAILAIQALPEEKRERSDMTDMCRILRSASLSSLVCQILSAEMHTGRILDLYPDHEEFAFAETEQAKVLLARIGSHREKRWELRREAMALNLAEKTGRSVEDCRADIDADATNYPPVGHDELDRVKFIG